MSPVIRTLIFSVVVPGFWTVMMPYWLLPSGVRPDTRGVGATGWLLIAAGIALYFACAFWGFAVRGKGTPLPLDPPKELVVEGPYRIVRNPMYWGVGSVVLGGGDLSLRRASRVGHCIRGRRDCFCLALRGAGTPAEIWRGIRRVLPACSEVAAAFQRAK